MCPPTYFKIAYSINPWMTTGTQVDQQKVVADWQKLVFTYQDLGYVVQFISPVKSLPDMVFSTDSAVIVDGVAYGARFRYKERQPEAPPYFTRFEEIGLTVKPLTNTAEGGDFRLAGHRILAGYGFRTDEPAHREVEQLSGKEVVSLELVSDKYYHLDTALTVVDEDKNLIAYYEEAFSPEALQRLRTLYPDAIICEQETANVFGLNCFADGKNVVITKEATKLINELKVRGYNVVSVDLGELLLAGGGGRCATLEIRR